MKKITLLMIVCLTIISCSKENDGVIIEDMNASQRLDPTGDNSDPCVMVTDLYAGQFIYVGKVTATYDPSTTLITVEYDTNLNKYKWTNDVIPDKTIKIISISANDFIGFDNNVENVIYTNDFIYSTKALNMAGDELVLLSMPSNYQ